METKKPATDIAGFYLFDNTFNSRLKFPAIAPALWLIAHH